MSQFTISDAQIQRYQEDGYLIVRDLFDQEETDLLGRIARRDQTIRQERVCRQDGEGGSVEIVVRNELSDDTIYGAVVRSERIVCTMESLLEGEVYHYHHKMILKEPHMGGAWAWHQDYGYWYDYGCLGPWLASCMIAVDSATRENGCLQVVRGSHQLGRIDHGPVGDQTGANMERVHVVCERLPIDFCELEAGSAVFFHCNLLHRSDQNTSKHPRWAFICCYNIARNSPYKKSRHPGYTRLEKWPDHRVAEVGRDQWQQMSTAERA